VNNLYRKTIEEKLTEVKQAIMKFNIDFYKKKKSRFSFMLGPAGKSITLGDL